MTRYAVQLSEFPLSTLFLIFLMLFVMLGTSPKLHRWLDRLLGSNDAEEAAQPQQEGEKVPQEGRSSHRDYEAIVFQQVALAEPRGLSAKEAAETLHFEKPNVRQALAVLQAQGMVRGGGGFFGVKFHLSGKGRERAEQEGILPRLRQS